MMESKTRGYRSQVRGRSFKANLRAIFSSTQRVIYILNALPEEVVESDTVTMLKKHLDKHLSSQDMVLKQANDMGVDERKGWHVGGPEDSKIRLQKIQGKEREVAKFRESTVKLRPR